MKITYKENNSESLGLMVVSFESKTTLLSGLSRTVNKSNLSRTRYIATATSISSNTDDYKLSFVKSDSSAFTKSDIRAINKWLFDDGSSHDLICQYNEEEIIYKGIFSNCEYQMAGIGIIGLNYTFSPTSPYCFKDVSETYIITDTSENISFDCDADISGYVYPVVEVTYSESASATIDIKNITDSNKKMCIDVTQNNKVTIDSLNQIVRNQSDTLSFDDLGWADAGSIYWFRLVNGTNAINVNKKCTIKISAKIPMELGEIYEY